MKSGVDRGYAWTVAASCFAIGFIMAGMSRAAGFLYVAIIEMYGVTREVATTPFGLRYSIRNMIGPIVGVLGQKYGIQAITVCGAILAGIGGSLCVFAPDVFWITILWGGVHGVGYGLCNLINIAILNDYFDKYRGTALGIALAGDCIGTFVFPVILEILVENYGVNGTFLILGAISLNVVPAGLLLRAPDWVTKKRNTIKSVPDQKAIQQPGLTGYTNHTYVADSTKNTVESNNIHLTSYLAIPENALHPVIKHEVKEDNGIFVSFSNSVFHTNNFEFSTNSKNNKINEFDLNILKVVDVSYIPDPKNDIYLGDKAKQNMIYSEVLRRESVSSNTQSSNKEKCNSILCPILSLKTNANMTVDVPQQEIANDTPDRSTLMNILIMNSRPMFLLIGVTLASYMFLFLSVVTVIIDFASDSGIAPEIGKFLLIGYSVADLIGRLGFGVVLDKKWIKPSYFACMTTCLMGLTTFAMPFYSSSFYYQLACMFLSGLVQGGNCIMYPILLGNYVDKKYETIALGCINVYGGSMMLPVGPVIGYFRDNIGSYDGVFLTVGSLSMFAGLLWLFEPCLWRLQQRMSK